MNNPATNKKIRVLIIAEAANPEWTSVPLLGWSHALALSKVCDTHLVTQIRNKDAIERFGWLEGKEFTAIDSEKIAAPMYKLSALLRGKKGLGWTIDTAIHSLIYPFFERIIWKRFKVRLEKNTYDIVHRITPVSPTAPSYLAKKLKAVDIPFIVGPLNGGVPWPSQFPEMQKKEKEWLNIFRSFYKLLPGYHSLRKNSSAIICGSKSTQNEMPEFAKHKLIYQPENAIDKLRFSMKNSIDASKVLRAAFVGRLVPYKGCDMAIEALEKFAQKGQIIFDIYGSGPDQRKIEKMIADKKLNKSVVLHGFVNNDVLQKQLIKADIFIFPSVREFGGGVILEAMALGIVPIVLDYAGPSELVNDECGYLIDMDYRSEVINNLKSILNNIIDDKNILLNKRLNSISRIEKYFTWEQKTKQDIRIYNWLLGKSKKPIFFN
ncbi:MAG: glycosyl transferase family 1 [Gammaproteobacteria bacterium]|nr:MAG: glycosyl transferase family 1 [Gammaproteobacteria bacterium]